MKQHFIYFSFLCLFSFIVSACEGETEGGTSNQDIVGVSQKVVELEYNSRTLVIHTETTGWWIERIEIDDMDTVIVSKDREAQKIGEATQLDYEWLTVSTSVGKIELSVKENDTDKVRTFKIYLRGENGQDMIEGVQLKQWTAEDDNIKLSNADYIEFAQEGGKEIVTVEGAGWWMERINVNCEEYYLTLSEREAISRGNEFVKTIHWLTIRVLGDKIELTAEPNIEEETGRSFSVGLKNGYYSKAFGGSQGAKLDGKYCDFIKLSQRTVEFGKEGGKVVVTSKGDGWWFTNMIVGGNIYTPSSFEKEAVSEGLDFEKKLDWLTVRSSYKRIELIAEPNHTDTMRTFNIGITAFLNFTGIEGVQKAK